MCSGKKYFDLFNYPKDLGLITRRSQVQILPPLPHFSSVKSVFNLATNFPGFYPDSSLPNHIPNQSAENSAPNLTSLLTDNRLFIFKFIFKSLANVEVCGKLRMNSRLACNEEKLLGGMFRMQNFSRHLKSLCLKKNSRIKLHKKSLNLLVWPSYSPNCYRRYL